MVVIKALAAAQTSTLAAARAVSRSLRGVRSAMIALDLLKEPVDVMVMTGSHGGGSSDMTRAMTSPFPGNRAHTESVGSGPPSAVLSGTREVAVFNGYEPPPWYARMLTSFRAESQQSIRPVFCSAALFAPTQRDVRVLACCLGLGVCAGLIVV